MAKRALVPPLMVLTLGHSTRSLESFIELLKAHDVEYLVDVRTVPRSRHNPQFNRESLPESLTAVRIKSESFLSWLRSRGQLLPY
jgi:uncharacterized protein (DUF488 family)